MSDIKDDDWKTAYDDLYALHDRALDKIVALEASRDHWKSRAKHERDNRREATKSKRVTHAVLSGLREELIESSLRDERRIADLETELADRDADVVRYREMYNQKWVAEIALRVQLDLLRAALVHAAVPLEVLNADNFGGATWMSDELRADITSAVSWIRTAISGATPNTRPAPTPAEGEDLGKGVPPTQK